MTTSPSKGIFSQFQRAWCADDCGRRIMLTRWHKAHGEVCHDCYYKALRRMEYDDEQRQLRGYTDAERERI
jgi:hypothetical protein